MKPTVSLQIIVKDEVDQVKNLVEKAYPFFDEVNLTVSDKTAANKLKKLLAIEANVKYREWNDSFADARNDNYKMSTTDYTFWVDADDSFDFTTVPEMLSIMEDNNIDAIFLPYNYAHDEQGNVITRHWRERLVKSGKGFQWRGAVHETYITEQDYTSHKVDNPVIHLAPTEKAPASLERNHAILWNEYQRDGENTDSRTLCYLGASFFSRGEYLKCIEILTEYLEVSGSVEDAYRSLSLISEAAYHLNQPDRALEYASKCIIMKPEYPMGYWLLAQYEADQKNWEAALEWVKVSLTKPDPNTLSVYDPSARERAYLIGAQAEFMLENYNAALQYLRKIPKNPDAEMLMEDFTSEADAETFTKLIPRISKFFKNTSSLWQALTPDIAYDKRLRALRNSATAPKKWNDKSIVIFCGQGYEEWGPHTLDKGMGGSEEAVVYLSRELAKLGYEVTVLSEADGVDYFVMNKWLEKGSLLAAPETHVNYRPWREIDSRDEFNIFVSWRSPQYLEGIKARVKLCDVHDVLPEEIMKDYPDVTYLVKSAYHRSLTPKLSDDKFRIIGNGIKKEQFNDNSTNNPV